MNTVSGMLNDDLDRPAQATKKRKKLNFDELIFKYRWPLTFVLIGVILIGFGVFFAKNEGVDPQPKVEVLESAGEAQNSLSEIFVEVSGSVVNPGVFKFNEGARIEDVLIAAGGVSSQGDRVWMEKYLNRAAKVSDGQKIYIPREDEDVSSGQINAENSVVLGTGGVAESGLININTATQGELETLWGIGPVYAQNIIEQRPYSSVEELLSKGVIKQNVYDRNKDLLTVY